MTVAELMLLTAARGGVEICFANAGTTEIPIVASLERVTEIRAVLGLFEGVCTAAADGYARLAGRPAMTLLHLGPGLANGVANLHNARRGNVPVINVVGEHASWHVANDPPLAMDIASLAGTISGWVRRVGGADTVVKDMGEALREAGKGQVVTLICPADYMGAPVTAREIPEVTFSSVTIDDGVIEKAAHGLREHSRTALILGGDALRSPGLKAAARIKVATGCDLLSVTFPPVLDAGAHLPELIRIPYFPKYASKVLAPYEYVILAGTGAPVTFFGYPGVPGQLLREDQGYIRIDSSIVPAAAAALEALADVLAAPPHGEALTTLQRPLAVPDPPTGVIDAQTLARAIAAVQPAEAIIVEEALMSGYYYHVLSPHLRPHCLLTLTGGAIGWGMPCALGAALACPERPVIALEADGSAMYTIQALWSQAREGANVTTILCNNRQYSTIGYEYRMFAGAHPGPAVRRLIDLDPPAIDWVSLGRSLGVPAVAVERAEDLVEILRRSVDEPGPHLVEVRLKKMR